MAKHKFNKGDKKPASSGRQPGVKNKKTQVLDKFIKDATEGGQHKFKTELSKLKGYRYVDAYLKLLEFCMPKYNRVSFTDPEGNAVPPVQIIVNDNKTAVQINLLRQKLIDRKNNSSS